MGWYYKLYELPIVKLSDMLMSLLRWADLPCFYPVFLEAINSLEAEKEMNGCINDLVAYDASLRELFLSMDKAVKEAKEEFNKRMSEAKKQRR